MNGIRHLTRVRAWIGYLVIGACLVAGSAELYAQAGRFGGYEIRVIRPKFMSKRGRMELGGQGSLIMNQAFIYSLLATGLLDYHFSEMFALEVGGSFGFSVDREDKRILEDEFEIKTQILRTKYIFSGGLLWTPVYGKTQMPSGQLVYFDSFATLQAGLTGIEYLYEQCVAPPADVAETLDEVPAQPSPTTKGYPTIVAGIGQKYFLDRDLSFRWDLRDHFFQYAVGDGQCNVGSAEASALGTKLHQNVSVQIGASTFF